MGSDHDVVTVPEAVFDPGRPAGAGGALVGDGNERFGGARLHAAVAQGVRPSAAALAAKLDAAVTRLSDDRALLVLRVRDDQTPWDRN